MNFLKKLQIRIVKNDILWISCLYFLAYGMMLLNRTFFTDSWNYWLCDINNAKSFFSSGGPQLRVLSLYFIPFRDIPNGDIIIRTLIFVSHWVSIVALYYCLKKIPNLSSFMRFLIVAFFAVFPINNARIELVHIHYAINTAFFWVAIYCFCCLFERKAMNYKLMAAALVLSLMSFTTSSYLVFYLMLLPLAYGFISNDLSFPGLTKFAAKNKIILALPFAYWVIRHYFLKPTGIMAKYYDISNIASVGGFLRMIGRYSLWLYHGFIQLYADLFSTFSFALPSLVMFALVLLVAHYLLLLLNKKEKGSVNPKHFALLGAFLVIGGLFPYCAIGKQPMPFNAASRHELLMGLGLSVITISALLTIVRRFRCSNGVMALIFAFALVKMVDFGIDRQYQNLLLNFRYDAIESTLRSNDEIKKHKTIIVYDRTYPLGRRTFSRSTIYTGLAHKAFGGYTRRYLNGDHTRSLTNALTKPIDERIRATLLLNDYRKSPPSAALLISVNEDIVSAWDCCALLFWRLKDSKEYRKRVQDLISIKALPVDQKPPPLIYAEASKGWLLTEKDFFHVAEIEKIFSRILSPDGKRQ